MIPQGPHFPRLSPLMICVLKVIDGPASGMKCWLKKDQRLTIGRLNSCDFSVAADTHMSRNHLIVEGLDSGFRLRDVGSSNGTYVNDLPISVVELCNGDHIKAGTSVFEVAFELGDAAPAESLLSTELDNHVPTRILGSNGLRPFSEEDTLRYELEPGMRAIDPAQAWGAVERGLDRSGSLTGSAPSQVSPALGASAEIDQNSLGKSAVDPLRSFFSEFLAPVEGVLWKQVRRSQPLTSTAVLNKLTLADWPATYSLILNRAQLAVQQCNALDYAISIGQARQLTTTLFLLEHSTASVVLEFYKHCLTKDAAVCVVSSEALRPAWVEQSIDLVSYPSMFAELMRKSPPRAVQFAQDVHFALFEPHADGELYLLRGSV